MKQLIYSVVVDWEGIEVYNSYDTIEEAQSALAKMVKECIDSMAESRDFFRILEMTPDKFVIELQGNRYPYSYNICENELIKSEKDFGQGALER